MYRIATLRIKLDKIVHGFRLRDSPKEGCADVLAFGKLYVYARVLCACECQWPHPDT